MLGERNWRELINKLIDERYNKAVERIDDINKISIDECVRCLRKAYYDRKEPIISTRLKMQAIISNCIRSGNKKEYNIDELILIAYEDPIIDGVLFHMRFVDQLPKEPLPEDLLYINASLFVFNVESGILIYVNEHGNSVEFSLDRDKRLFNEVIRRAKILNILLKEGKAPVIEPSNACLNCQYYERCYMHKLKEGETLLDKILGKTKD